MEVTGFGMPGEGGRSTEGRDDPLRCLYDRQEEWVQAIQAWAEASSRLAAETQTQLLHTRALDAAAAVDASLDLAAKALDIRLQLLRSLLQALQGGAKDDD